MANNVQLCAMEKEVTARKLKRFKLICLGAQGTTCINILLWLGGNLHIPILLLHNSL